MHTSKEEKEAQHGHAKSGNNNKHAHETLKRGASNSPSILTTSALASAAFIYEIYSLSDLPDDDIPPPDHEAPDNDDDNNEDEKEPDTQQAVVEFDGGGALLLFLVLVHFGPVILVLIPVVVVLIPLLPIILIGCILSLGTSMDAAGTAAFGEEGS